MIRIVCPNCQSKLDAKEKLIGQMRNCPKCGHPVLIKGPDDVAAAAVPRPVLPAAPAAAEKAAPNSGEETGVPSGKSAGHKLDRLVRLNRYLICDRTKVIAAWENNGQGWRLHTDRGFISAARNADKIPSQGDFKLIELKMHDAGDRLHLHGLTVYQFVQRWALTNLIRGDDAVLKSIVGPGGLGREQKAAVRQHLGEQFMREVWQDARAVLDYLADADYHSPGVG